MGKLINKFYETYKNFAILLFIFQNILLFITILVIFPSGEVLITTNSLNEMYLEIFWTGSLVLSSIMFGVIHVIKKTQ